MEQLFFEIFKFFGNFLGVDYQFYVVNMGLFYDFMDEMFLNCIQL